MQYDLPVFTIFQEILANTLNLEVGEYYHTANSLHVYDYHFDSLEKIKELQPVEFTVPYKLEHMKYLSEVTSQIHTLQSSDLEEDDSPFLLILRSLLRKKQHLPYQIMPLTDFAWADQFLQYELKDTK